MKLFVSVVAASLLLVALCGGPAVAQNSFPAAGKVGIGTTSPTTSLTIVGQDPGAMNSLGFRTESTQGYSIGMFVSQSRGVFGSTNMTPVDFISNGILPKMTLSTDGNLGIGTTAPISRLNISGADPGTGSVLLGVRVENASGFNAGIGVAGNRATIGATNATPIDFMSGSIARMTVDPSGNIGVGTKTPVAMLHVAGNIQVDGNIAAKYQDVAEWVKAPRQFDAGTVLIIDSGNPNQVLVGSQPYDTRVAGVVSDRPGVLLGEGAEDRVKVAHTGRVKVKVDASFGSVATGDLLVTSPIEGFAMRSKPVDVGGVSIHRPGTLIGKALEPLSEGQGEILVLLMLQ